MTTATRTVAITGLTRGVGPEAAREKAAVSSTEFYVTGHERALGNWLGRVPVTT